MSDVTLLLNQIDDGDLSAAEQLLPLVYDELRKLAASRMLEEDADHILQPTALVHEAYLRLVRSEDVPRWSSRGHFFAAAANAMRRILIDNARSKRALKRGGESTQIQLDEAAIENPEQIQDQLLEIDDALLVLQKEDFDAAEIVKLRIYAGLSVEDAGKVLGMPRSSAYHNWNYARAWFKVYFDETSS